MKTLTKIFCSLMKKNIKFYPNSSFIILLVLILFITWMSGFVSTCFAQSPWTQKADIPTIRADHSSCALDGKIYVLGGGSGADQGTKTLYVYDPILNNWASKANMAKSRMRFPVCVFNGKILAIGGSQTMHSSPITSIEEYDPVSDSWTDKAIMPRARLGLTAAMVDGKIYIIGGCTEAFISIPEVDVYDPNTGDWTTAADLLTPRWWSASVVLNGKIYVLGGEKSSPWPGLHTVEAYDPETDTWSSKEDMITQRKLLAACVLNDMIYVFGGARFGTAGPTSSVEAYDPVTDTWTERSDMPASIVKQRGNVVDGKAYLSGGLLTPGDYSTTIKTMYEYNPHNDLLPLIEKIEVDKSYVKSGTDSVCITTKIKDKSGITLMAKIEAPDQTPVDSLQLFDDGNHNDGNAGDNLYANVCHISSYEEQNYTVDLEVTRIDADTIIHLLNNMAKFTTIGPVDFESYTLTGEDLIPNPGDQVKLKITLTNNGSTTTATNVNAELVSPDTLVSVLTTPRYFGNIAAGESKTYAGYFTIEISNECPVDTLIPIIINITSNNFIYAYTSDTFLITVQKPSNIEDIREQIARIYPNPTDNILNIEVSNSGKLGLEIEIFTITGTIIYQKEYKYTSAHFATQVNLSGYEEGIYLLKVRQADSVYIGKVVVR